MEQMTNPLDDYLESFKQAMRLNNAYGKSDYQQGYANALKDHVETLTAIHSQLENRITWTEGPPVEDGEYLVEFNEFNETGIVFGKREAPDNEEFHIYNSEFGLGHFAAIRFEQIIRHARLKVG